MNVLGFLDYQDLCTSQLVNRRLARLAEDHLVWKALYRQDFPNRPLKRGKVGDSPQKRHKQLGTISIQDHVKRENIDWKKRYRTRLNWSIGRCHTSHDRSPDAATGCVRSQANESALTATQLTDDRAAIIKTLPTSDAVVDIMPLVGNRVVFSTRSHLYICHTSIPAVTPQHTLQFSSVSKVIHEAGFLAILTQANALFIYDIGSSAPQLVTALKANACYEVVLNSRSLADNAVFSLAFTETGLFSATLRLQEIILSGSTRSLLSSRSATSLTIAPEPHSRCRDKPMPTEVVYDHPYLLVPSSNNISLHLVSSSPTSLSIDGPEVLHGYTASIKSCRVNKALRFVVGLGSAGLRVWDMNLSSHGVSVSRDDIDEVLNDSASEEILGVSETKVIAMAESGRVIVHDFAV